MLTTNSAFNILRHQAFCRSTRHRQNGVVLIFALIALTIMLTGAVALISSFNTSLTAAGNIGFKRDFQNQSERATAAVLREFSLVTGAALDTPAKRANNIISKNYSAVRLTTNNQGIPLILLGKLSIFDATWLAGTINPGKEIKVRYVIDRLCNATGEADKLLTSACAPCSKPEIYGFDEIHLQGESADKGLHNKVIQGGAGVTTGVGGSVKKPVSYRLTTRVSGPRDTEAFFQTTFCEPLP